MAYRSVFTGQEVSKAVKYMLNPNIGVTLTFDASTEFPSEAELQGADYRDVSTRNIYVDASANLMYRWKYVKTTEDDEDYPFVGYKYVVCAGGGGGDLYWEEI